MQMHREQHNPRVLAPLARTQQMNPHALAMHRHCQVLADPWPWWLWAQHTGVRGDRLLCPGLLRNRAQEGRPGQVG